MVYNYVTVFSLYVNEEFRDRKDRVAELASIEMLEVII